jgi:hypothetical protein
LNLNDLLRAQNAPVLAAGYAAASSSTLSDINIAIHCGCSEQNAKKDPYIPLCPFVAAKEIILCHLSSIFLKRALQTGASLKLQLNASMLCHNYAEIE